MPLTLAAIITGYFAFSYFKTIGRTIYAMFRCNSNKCRGGHLVKAAINITAGEVAEEIINITCDGCGQSGQAKVKSY